MMTVAPCCTESAASGSGMLAAASSPEPSRASRSGMRGTAMVLISLGVKPERSNSRSVVYSITVPSEMPISCPFKSSRLAMPLVPEARM